MAKHAYYFQGCLLCTKCAQEIRRLTNVSTDPDVYPIGPYVDAGGKSDYPAMCEKCSTFLENELTAEGLRYVRRFPLAVWAKFYCVVPEAA